MNDPHLHLLPSGEEGYWKNELYEGLFVAPIAINEKMRHCIVRMQSAHEGGMREFLSPFDDTIVGSCGCNFARDQVLTLSQWTERYA